MRCYPAAVPSRCLPSQANARGASATGSCSEIILGQSDDGSENVAINGRLESPAPDSLIRSEQSEVTESLFDRRDLVWWAGILLVRSWGGEAKLLFAARNPGALGHKAVLPRYPFLDFLVRDAWTKRFMLAVLTRAFMSSFLVSTTHAGSGW